MRDRERGFTLVELIIACSLAVIVLLAIVGMMTSMFRFQVEGLRKSTVTGWSLASLMKMNKEIESASVLGYPATNGTQADSMTGCTNWSRVLGSRADTNQNVVVFYYCYDSATKTLRRMAQESAATTCPASPATPPACSAAWSGANRTNDIIAVGVNHHSDATSPLVFTRDDGVGGVRVRYIVGEKTYAPVAGKPDIVNPQYMEFDTTITLSRPYANTND